MSRILLLAATTGYQTRIFAEAARRLGLELTLATDRCHVLDDPWGDQATAVRFEDPCGAAEQLAADGYDGIVAVGDRPTQVAALTAERLGVPYHPPGAVAACRDKYVARHLYQASGLLVPDYFRVHLDDDPHAAAANAFFPCVLKPLGLSGSRGVIRANNEPEFLAAFDRIKAILERPEVRMLRETQHAYLQVESYIEGRELALEGLVTAGRLQTLAVFDKPEPLRGPFFEETIYLTPSQDQDAIAPVVQEAVRALGLSHGPVHAEVRLNTEGVYMLDIAARPIGGLCARSLRFNGGMPLEELILRHAVGEDVSHARLDGPASGVMMIPIPAAGVFQEVEGIDRAKAVAGIEDVIVTAKPGHRIVPLPEGASYLGFIFARTDTPRDVEIALRNSHAQLNFRIAPELPVVSPSSGVERSRGLV